MVTVSAPISGQPGIASLVTVWNYPSGKERLSFPTTVKAPSVVFSPDGRFLALGGQENLEICEAETGKVVRRFNTPAQNLAWSPAGRYLATASGANVEIRVWDPSMGTLLLTLLAPQVGGGCVHSRGRLAFSPDGQFLAGASENNHLSPNGSGGVTVWEVATGKELMTLRGHTSEVNGIAFSPDGRRLISGSRDRTVRLWELATGNTTLILRGHKEHIRSVAFSPDGSCIASNSREVRIWDGSPVAVPAKKAATKR
jgi:WD40 repeat protein